MNINTECLYSKSHEWVRIENDTAYIGITDYAQNQLGDIVFVGLPVVGDKVSTSDAYSDVESVKVVSDVYSPVDGTISEVNTQLESDPALLNTDPYGTWIAKLTDISSTDGLMTPAEYEEYCAAL